MTVAIHQPNFCPWNPYFDKIRQSDLFVIMGHCQFSSGGYQNRFFAGDQWNTMSVQTKKKESIIDKQYIYAHLDWLKITTRFPSLKVFDGCISSSLFQTNYSIILKACHLLGIDMNKICKDFPTHLLSTERLVEICLRHGATEYLSGPSGKHYLDFSQFERAGIKLRFHETPKDKRPLCEII